MRLPRASPESAALTRVGRRSPGPCAFSAGPSHRSAAGWSRPGRPAAVRGNSAGGRPPACPPSRRQTRVGFGRDAPAGPSRRRCCPPRAARPACRPAAAESTACGPGGWGAGQGDPPGRGQAVELARAAGRFCCLWPRAASSPCSTKRCRTQATVDRPTSRASAILWSAQAGPPSAWSALSRIRAWPVSAPMPCRRRSSPTANVDPRRSSSQGVSSSGFLWEEPQQAPCQRTGQVEAADH